MNNGSTVPMTDARLLFLLAMEETVHRLSQPLTSISFALELATLPGAAAERDGLMESAKLECERAMACVADLREGVSKLLGDAKGMKEKTT